MKTHEFLHPAYARSGHAGRGAAPSMQVHENHCMKRAGVAGVRARASGIDRGLADRKLLMELHLKHTVVLECCAKSHLKSAPTNHSIGTH